MAIKAAKREKMGESWGWFEFNFVRFGILMQKMNQVFENKPFDLMARTIVPAQHSISPGEKDAHCH